MAKTVMCVCGAKVSAGAKFCSECGKKIVTEDKRVCACGAKLRKTDKFCSECGKPVVDAGKGASAPTTPKTEGLVPFTKANGEVKMVSPAQAQAWGNWKDRNHMTLDEVKNTKFNGFTDEMREYVKAHPTTSKSQMTEQFGDAVKGMSRPMLNDLKVELGLKPAK